MSLTNQNQSGSIIRLHRLIAIVIILQTKRIVTAVELASRFAVSVRTIYRDIKLLEQAEVPVSTEEGKGFTLMEGYKVPPFLFTESEAGAIITAEKFIAGNNDESLVKNYASAVDKVKAVLRYTEKDKMELLSTRIKVYANKEADKMSNHLSMLQQALTDYCLIKLHYKSLKMDEVTERIVEPFALFYAGNSWLLLAFCRLRSDYRFFRLDRFQSFEILSEKFEPHKMTISKYLDELAKKELNP